LVRFAPPVIFDESARVGGFIFDPADDLERQIARITDSLVKRAGAELLPKQATKERDTAKEIEEV
jgi:hypothetical protein